MSHLNTLFIFTDQHNPTVSGFSGNASVKTPNLDRIASEGVVFSNAFCTSPLSCPSRASMLTGTYVHQGAWWDNAFPYHGEQTGWSHKVRSKGIRIDAIGKLHFRDADDDNGFVREHNTMHTVKGGGDILGCVRDETTLFDKRTGVVNAGKGTSSYTHYDAENAAIAAQWIQARKNDKAPWVLFLGIALPHPPNLVPGEYFDQYKDMNFDIPPQWEKSTWPTHPAMEYVRKYFNFESPVSTEELQRFTAAYYGACTYVDTQIGVVLDALSNSGAAERTQIIYSSDHGEDLGARGIFGKFHLLNEAVKVPLVISNPELPKAKLVETPVSLADMYPTIMETYSITYDRHQNELAGDSLFGIAESPDEKRNVFAEYHGPGTQNAMYMLYNGQYKYIYHVDGPEQLFDLKDDPDESQDIAREAQSQLILSDFKNKLLTILDPEKTDLQAKHDQLERINNAGGRDAVIAKGTFDNSPVPGEEAVFFKRKK